ncbi:C1 family peptidase [Silvanigrella aquatica]|uniref:Uncharacterized protein n=1 Tax=Silvanigrella aquatica TaxID=1915309 RepID=A0A1L4CZ00_9BACT|nr:C1 family peptidase [Silvanigrella aquatica]APJ03172.1 hypothetical protein AXG55_04340 [Silvanigrella aquatica]
MRNFISTIALSSLAVLTINAYAETSEHFVLDGSHTVTIPLKIQNDARALSSFESLTGVKTIQLMKIHPTAKMIEKNRQALDESEINGGEIDYSNGIIPFSQSPGAVDLGMANVPVLDQGSYGTCVTFSSTAALDARLKIGDYIDQQCSLALNNALGNNYWNGAYDATQVLAPLKQHGIVQKGNCFGSQYPTPNQKVSANDYKKVSEKHFSKDINYVYYKTASLNDLKAGLKKGHRFAIGFALADNGDPISVNGFDMNVGGTPTSGGLWACQQPESDTNFCGDQNAGHEVIVIGYDDNQQLLKIRNSWSDQVADNGDYYMTYTFYKAMTGDQTEIK